MLSAHCLMDIHYKTLMSKLGVIFIEKW